MKKIALVGAGQMGSNHARTVFRSDDFELTHVIDQDSSRAEVLAKAYGAIPSSSLEILDKVDAVIVASSTSSHFPVAMEALSFGLPVLLEKPLTNEWHSTLELVQAAEKAGVPIQCGFVERFNPAMATARRLLTRPIVHAQSVRHSPPATRIASGVAEDLLVHDIDLAVLLSTAPLNSVTGYTYKPENSGFAEIADCSLQFADQSVFSLSANRMGQRKIRDWRLYTDKDLIEVDLLRQTVAIYENINQEVGSGGGASYRARTTIDYPFIERSGEPLAMQLQHFAALLEGRADFGEERDSIVATHEVLFRYLDISQ